MYDVQLKIEALQRAAELYPNSNIDGILSIAEEIYQWFKKGESLYQQSNQYPPGTDTPF